MRNFLCCVVLCFPVFMISLLSLFVTASYGTFKTEGRFPLEALPFGIMAVINVSFLVSFSFFPTFFSFESVKKLYILY